MDLLQKVHEFEKKHEELRRQQNLLEAEIKQVGPLILEQINQNGWTDPSKGTRYIIRPWYGFKSGRLGDQDWARTKQLLSTTPVSNWRRELGIKFEISEVRTFDDQFYTKKEFSAWGGDVQKGFYSSWSNNICDYSKNEQFLRKAGKTAKIYFLINRDGINEKAKVRACEDRRGFIRLTNNMGFEGLMIAFGGRSDKVTTYDGYYITETMYPGKKKELMEKLDQEVEKFYQKIETDAAIHLTSPDPYTRYYAENILKDRI